MRSEGKWHGIDLEVVDQYGRTVLKADQVAVSVIAEVDEEEITIRSGDGSVVASHITPSTVKTTMTVRADESSSMATSAYPPATSIADTREPPEILYVNNGEDGTTRLSTMASHRRLRQFALDLNRCEHGITRGEQCQPCNGPDDRSLGNPVHRGETPLSDVGYIIMGYSVFGHPYVLAPDLEDYASDWSSFDESVETLKYARIWLVDS